ncbi:Histidine kinase [Gammaproteobacteria bacterium]
MPEKFFILVVDDNANNRFTLRALLARLPDCEIVEAASGEEALIRTIEHDIHLILLDVQMPTMDGFETARHLQMTERTRYIPVVFISAVFKSEDFIRHGYTIGAVDYLTKPLDDNLLLNRVRLYRRLHRHEQELEARVAQLQHQEQALAAARDAAEAANRAKSVFLSNMSHELRTPLNAILGFAQLMEHDERIPEDERRNLRTINRSGRHLLALINDVLEISRIEAGGIMVHNETFDLIDTLHSVEDMIRVRAKHKDLDFAIENEDQLPSYVYGDAHRLRQVLLNLLSNAVKYTDRGQVRLCIYSTDKKHIRFDISDTGPGITPEDQERIFQAFYQTEVGIAKGEGTGLGLTISREFVRLMGGELTVRSELGKGSVLSFTLPLPQAAVAAPVSVAQHGRVIALADGQFTPRILIAEDDADSRELIARLLDGVGFEVSVVENGQLAVEAFQTWQPHFIWMDIKMPVLDGFAATKAIRALPGGREVKIGALTASAFREDRERILATGCDELVTKPLEEEKIFATMGQLLNLRYRYAEPAVIPTAPSLREINLAVLPAVLREELMVASELLDLEAAYAIVERIRADYPEPARAIAELINGYRFDKIAELCRDA